MVESSYCISHIHKTRCVRALCISFKCMHVHVGYRSKIYPIIYREYIFALFQHIRNIRVVSYKFCVTERVLSKT